MAASDYTNTSNMLTFSSGQTVLTFTVPITPDIISELDETVLLTLSNPGNATIGPTNPATLTILNDDFPVVEFSNANYNVVENQGSATITTTLSSVSSFTVTVAYSTSNGTAIAGSDYIPISGTLTFAPGVTTRTFTVTIVNDAGAESTEALTLTLSNPVSATLGTTNPATLTIFDDGDIGACNAAPYSPPHLDIGPPDCKWTNLGLGGIITVNLVLSGTIPITVDGNPDFDLIYYERERDIAPGEIALDMVQIEVSTDTVTWYEVFNWGNAITDTNTNIGQAGYVPPEPNNQIIPMSNPPLYGASGGIITGIAIDVDNPPAGSLPAGSYLYVRLTDSGGPAEVDAIEVLPP
jgi:hypothetical protein